MASGLNSTMYGSDGTTKMKPSSNTSFQYNEAVAPAAETNSDRPLYVIINVGHATKYEFKYIEGGAFVDYGIIPISSNSGAGPIRLDIQPIAWKGGAGATGDVTFVYKGRI